MEVRHPETGLFIKDTELGSIKPSLFDIVTGPFEWIGDQIRLAIRKVVYFFQRGTRGWADEDVYDFDFYLAKVISGGLDRMVKHTYSYPNNVENFGEWQRILRKMSKGFKAGINQGELGFLGVDSHYAKMKGLDKEFKSGAELFVKHFWHLWI